MRVVHLSNPIYVAGRPFLCTDRPDSIESLNVFQIFDFLQLMQIVPPQIQFIFQNEPKPWC